MEAYHFRFYWAFVSLGIFGRKPDKKDEIVASIYNALGNRRKKLTDMLLDARITKEAYDEKYDDMTFKITRAKEE